MYEGNTYPLQGFAERLEQAIKDSNYSKIRLANHIGVHRRTIYNYVDGVTVPNFTIVGKLAVALNVSFDWLAFGKKD